MEAGGGDWVLGFGKKGEVGEFSERGEGSSEIPRLLF